MRTYTKEQILRRNKCAREYAKKMRKLAKLGDPAGLRFAIRKNKASLKRQHKLKELAKIGNPLGLDYIRRRQKACNEYYKRNTKKVLKHSAEYREGLGLKKRRVIFKKYYKENYSKVLKSHKLYMRRKRATDPKFRLKQNLRTSVAQMCRENNITARPSTTWLLSISKQKFIQYLEKQFRKGMDWDNYGRIWNVDHRMPINHFNIGDPKQLLQCQHYSNFQPLFGWENIMKGNRILPKEKARFNRIWASNKTFLARRLKEFFKVSEARIFRGIFMAFGKIDTTAM
jgi:hypothetical protein